MSTPVRVLGFLLGLAAVFGVALGVGRAVGPVTEPVSATTDAHGEGHESEPSPDGAGATDVPGGLMVSQDGYTLSLAEDRAPASAATPVSFTIDGPDGAPVTAYDVEHDERLHLIAVRRDFTGFQHVHPELAADGTWSTDLALTPGSWRLFADFAPTGADALTLGADLTVPGDHVPAEHGADSRTAEVDGYTVALAGDLEPGAEADLTLTVSRDGEPVTDLEPYLDAYGHLVALREGDLAYLHVHPVGTPGDGTTEAGPEVRFGATVPSVGRYRLFLDFQHQGTVRTAEFALTAGEDDHDH